MASADYYNSGGGLSPAPQNYAQPQSQPHPSQQHLNPPYPMSDAPPPYTERPVSQPPAQQRPPPPSEQYRPSPQPQYPSEKPSSRPISTTPPRSSQNVFQASDFRPQQPPPQQQQQQPRPSYPQQPQGFLGPESAMGQAYGNNPDNRRPSSTPAKPQGILKNGNPNAPYNRPQYSRSHSRSYSSSRSRSRDREGHRRHHHHHHHHNNNNNYHNAQRPDLQPKKGSGLKTFLGAGGGAIIGDAIFPGLGTLGGAIIGGIGGHEYGKKQRGTSGSNSHRSRSYSNNDDDYYYDERRGRRY